jgi:hypothetical protein
MMKVILHAIRFLILMLGGHEQVALENAALRQQLAVFSRLAEYAKTLLKGTHVMVQGSVRSREYESDGVRHRIFELRADTIAKLDRAEHREQEESAVSDL